MNRPSRIAQTTVGLLIVGFLALLFIVGMTYWLGERAQFYLGETVAARETGAASIALRHALLTAETSQRGYLVSGNQIYLAPYGTAKTDAQRQLDLLKSRLQAFPETRPVTDRLTAILADKFAEMDQTIGLQRDRRVDEAVSLFRSNRGKALMDEANVFLSSIVRSADDRLTAVVAEQTANAGLLRIITIIGGVLIVLVVGAVVFIILRYLRELAGARDEVSVLNGSLERRVEERTADLAQANEEIQRFAYIVTHDLRAPLVNIMGFTSELERGIGSLQAMIDKSPTAADSDDPVVKQATLAATQDLPEAITFIRSSTRKMDGLINAILKLSREGRRQLRPERVVLRALADATVSAIQHQLGEAGGEATLDIDVPSLVTDRLSLEQVIGNLLDNAVKYRAKTRPLRVTVRARAIPGSRVEIEVSDNGRGIADSDRERVFDLFRRAGPQDQPGEGIGLALVRTLVRNLGGDISVSSSLGIGTTFRIVLPSQLQIPENKAA